MSNPTALSVFKKHKIA